MLKSADLNCMDLINEEVKEGGFPTLRKQFQNSNHTVMYFKLGTVILFMTFTIQAHSQDGVKPAFETLAGYPNVRDLAVTPGTKEAFFTMQSLLGDVSVIVSVKKENLAWLKPKIVSFSGEYNDLEPALSPDGLRLYFASNRPLTDTTESPKDYDIWYVERENILSAWGEPVNVGDAVNSVFDEFYPSVTASQNLYFTSTGTGTRGKDDIFLSEWKSGSYAKPVSLSEAINTEGYEFNGYVSADESFLIFSGYNREDGVGSGDMYISFRDETGQWGKAINLGATINSPYMDYCPFVDLENEVLYFTSKRTSPVKKQRFENIEQLMTEITKYQNGASRLYKVSIKDVLMLRR